MALHAAHRLARLNYAPRALAFGYTFIVLWTMAAEGRASFWVLPAGVLQFLIYPHLAYLHARLVTDSKRAEVRNLFADALMLGGWVAQLQFALWPACGILAAVCLNSAANGGLTMLVRAVGMFALGSLAWGALAGFQFNPNTGPLVSVLSGVGLIAYTSYVGQILFDQNTRLLRARDALRNSEAQFRFVAEHAGDLVAVIDPAGRIRYASSSHSRQFAERSYVPGANWLDLVHPEDRLHAVHFLELLVSSEPDNQEPVHLRMGTRGNAWQVMECQGNAVWDDREKARLAVVILRDVDARVRIDIERQLA
jgi:PAS domain S-box-containing protein